MGGSRVCSGRMSPSDEADPDPSAEQPSRLEGLLSDAAGGMGGTLLALGIGGPAGAVAGSVISPGLSLLSRLAFSAFAKRRGRAAQTLVDAAAIRDMTPEALAEALLADDRRVEVAARLLTVAAETTLPEKRRAMARLLAETAGDDDLRVDLAAEFARAWAELDFPHIALLRLLATQPPTGEVGWSEEGLAKKFPDAAIVLVGLVNALAQRNTIRDIALGTWNSAAGIRKWTITDFGEQLLYQLAERRSGPLT